uniref:Transmembrane protein n=1 Tax=Aegilops tauschii subsp. strangulata TaxID=200361 RepID=A0A453CLH8_AEGTS
MIFGSGLNLLSAALGFGMTAVFVAFVCARFICCRARGVDDGAPTPVDFDVDFPADLERPVRVIPSTTMAPLPPHRYSAAVNSTPFTKGEHITTHLLVPQRVHN